jgi:hypothetical protein
MAQLDGSDHDWFEGRGPRCVLMVMVDDATNRVWAQFFEAETTHASYDMLDEWSRQHGLPQSLYVDRDSIYRCEGVGSVAEQLAGKEPLTQFGRDETDGSGIDFSQQSAGQRPGGTDEWSAAGPVGQSPATGRNQRDESGQRISEKKISAGVQPEV